MVTAEDITLEVTVEKVYTDLLEAAEDLQEQLAAEDLVAEDKVEGSTLAQMELMDNQTLVLEAAEDKVIPLVQEFAKLLIT
jgi:hypothetical protein